MTGWLLPLALLSLRTKKAFRWHNNDGELTEGATFLIILTATFGLVGLGFGYSALSAYLLENCCSESDVGDIAVGDVSAA